MHRYETIEHELERRLDSGKLKPGDRLPSEHELAAAHGVHRLTARRVLSSLQQKGRIVRKRGRGSFVAEAKAWERSVLYIGDMESHFFRDLFLAFTAEAQARHMRLHGVQPLMDTGSAWRETLAAHMADSDALIVMEVYYSAVRTCLPAGFDRVVRIDIMDVVPDGPAYVVLVDYGRAVMKAVDCLVGLGHHRLAMLTPEGAVPGKPDPAKPYYAAFLAALNRHGLDRESQWIPVKGLEEAEHNHRKVRSYLENPLKRPTAIVCDADFRARVVYDVARELGLAIPGDLSVTGLGDTPWSDALSPRLTSVNLGEKDVARIALALCARGKPDTPLVCRVEPSLVPQSSTASPAVAGRRGSKHRLRGGIPVEIRTTKKS